MPRTKPAAQRSWPAWLKNGRVLFACLLALALALNGERIVRDQQEAGVPASVFWYGLAIVVLVVGTWGTFVRRRLLPLKPVAGAADTLAVKIPMPRSTGRTNVPLWLDLRFLLALRLLATALAIGLGVAGMQTLRADTLSAAGMWLWLGSMALLLVAWRGQRIEPWRDETELPLAQRDSEIATDWRVPLRLEIVFVALVILLALALRLYGLDNLIWGIHGDEGEAATDALAILNGKIVSPFTTGWFSQPNFYYWSIAIGMKLFGISVFGLRISTVFFSMITFVPFYLLVRRMFGVRAALIALPLLATNAMFLHYSRPQLSLITTPAFWVLGFYFLVRGLQERCILHFVLAAYCSFFSLYFYFGARILPFMMIGFFVYMAVFARHFLRRYLPHMTLFAVAAFLMAAPFLGYYLDNTSEINARSSEKFIYNNIGDMRAMYGEPESLELLGAAWTPPENLYFFWRQLTLTGSMFTYRPAFDSFYDFTGQPVINFLESALLILGMALAIWRWRDARFGFLLIWFMATFIAGGVLTVEAPYTPRLAGLFPTLPIFFAIIINKIAAEWSAFSRLTLTRLLPRRANTVLAVALVGVLVVGLAFSNVYDYYGRFVENHWVSAGSAQALFVEQNGPSYKYYEIGAPFSLDFNNGSIRFIRESLNIDGRDLLNPGSSVPFSDSNGKDALFIVNNGMAAHMLALQDLYPAGTATPYNFDTIESIFTSFSLPKEAISATQRVNVAYVAAGSDAVRQSSNGIGTADAPPPQGAAYPLAASWIGGLVAPAFASYGFRLTVPAAATLLIDGREVLPSAAAGVVEVQTTLARGVHSFRLTTSLPQANAQVSLLWRLGSGVWRAPSGVDLWNGALGGLLGEIYPLRDDAVSGGLAVDPAADGVLPLERRVDSLIDWRRAEDGFAATVPFTARWRGEFVAQQEGEYKFETLSNNDNGVWIDDQPVAVNLSNGGLDRKGGNITLAAGAHQIEVRYNCKNPLGVMVLYGTAPEQAQKVANGTMFGPTNGVWLPGEIAPPPPTLELGTSTNLTATRTIRLPGLKNPRALAVSPDNNIYVADTDNTRIVVYNGSGQLLRTLGSRGEGPGQFKQPTALAFSSAGELFVADHDLGNIQVFNVAGELLRTVQSLRSPNGLSVAADGTLYVANTAGSDVLRIAPDGTTTSLSGGDAAGADKLNQPLEVLAAPDGTVYAADLSNRIVRLNSSGLTSENWSLPVARFQGSAKLAMLNGLLYMADPDNNRISRLDPATGAGELFDMSKLATPMERPVGIAAAAGELYILDGVSGVVQVFKIRP